MRARLLFTYLALAAVVVVGASGCNGQPDGSALTVQTLAEPGSDHFRLLEAALAKFEELHPETKVTLVGGRLKLDYLMRSIIARQSADVLEVCADEIVFLATRGALTNLTADCLSLYPECSPRAWKWGVLEKRFYAVPWAALPTLLLYDKQAFRAAKKALEASDVRERVSPETWAALLKVATALEEGVPPETWNELINAAAVLTLTRDVDGDGTRGYGFAFAGKNSVDLGRHFATFLAQLGQPLLQNNNGIWAFRIDTVEGRRATKFLLELQKVAPPECVVTDDAAALEQFRAGKAAMVFATPAGLTCCAEEHEHMEIAAAPMPAPAEGVTRSDVSFRYMCVPAFVRGERRAAAARLATFMAGPEAQEIVARGLHDTTPAITVRQELLEGDFYGQRPQLHTFARAIRSASPVFPSLVWEGKCSKDWLGWIHSALVDDRRSVDEVVTLAQEKGDQALSCLYTDIGHPSLTIQLGMVTAGMLVFAAVAYIVARR